MPLGHTLRLASCAAAITVLGSCTEYPTEPLMFGVPIAVSIETSHGGPLTNLPRIQIVGLAGEVRVQWDVASGGCILVNADGLQADGVIDIQIHRAGDPLALCTTEILAFHYVARAKGIAPGSYEIHVFDVGQGREPQVIGVGSVVVSAAN